MLLTRETIGPPNPSWEEFVASDRVIAGTAGIVFGLFKPTAGPAPHGATPLGSGYAELVRIG